MPEPQPPRRIEAVDVLRGVIMIVMALDHTRDFFGVAAISPTDVARASAPLFLTRWVTHFCAPVFFLLTGVGAGLARKSRSSAELARYLLVRGALLIVLELTLVRGLSYQFNFDYRVTLLLVLWALGWAMIVLGFLVFLPRPLIAVLGLVMIAGHNAFDAVASASPWWAILHRPGFVLQGAEHTIFAAYPLVPWVGVTAVGFVLASVYSWPAERRRRFLLATGTAAVVAFVVLRAVNVYGDPGPWSVQATPLKTVLSFLNANKYPPSLLFLLMTLGPALLFLRFIDDGTPRLLRVTLGYGREPMFYYVAHFALIHLLAVAACLGRYGTAHWMFESPTLAAYP
ncbi:MAG: DUF1624 domain-containing protein, partial [Gemmatimonadaceae bacterium]